MSSSDFIAKGDVTYTMKIGDVGQSLDAIADEINLIGFSTSSEVSKIPSARIVIADLLAVDEPFKVSNRDDFAPGKAVELLVGYQSEEETIFEGVIVKHRVKLAPSGSTTIVLECRDLAMKMTVGRKSKYFYNTKDSDAIGDLIAAYDDLSSQVETTELQHLQLVQYHCSDWDFLCERAEANGLIVTTEAGNITIGSPDTKQKVELELKPGGNLLEFEAEMDARNQYAKHEAHVWNPTDGLIQSKESEEQELMEQGNLQRSDLADVVGLESFAMRHSGQLADEEVVAWANARDLRTSLSRIKGRAKYKGTQLAKPGSFVKLLDAGERFQDYAFVSAIRHTVGEGTWVTDCQLGCDAKSFAEQHPDIAAPKAAGLIPPINGLQVGLVSEIEEDPDGEDRIQVVLPLIDAEEKGVWARLASLDAGEHRGTFFRPEKGDEVIVGFINDDPRHAVVLGQLNSKKRPAPLEATTDNHVKGIFTRSGIRLAFDDDNRTLTLQTLSESEGGSLADFRSGNPDITKNQTIVLDDKSETITISDKHENKIELSSDGIKLSSILDVTIEGENVNITANSNLVAEGKMSSKFSSGGNNTIKGSQVLIN